MRVHQERERWETEHETVRKMDSSDGARKDNRMLIVVDPHSGVPVYRQLMDQIKFHIASGLLVPGEELPSTRALSSELGVNPMTISKAYSFLEREGVLERRPGRPLVVRAVESEQIRAQKIEQLRQSLISSVTMAKHSVSTVCSVMSGLLSTKFCVSRFVCGHRF